MNLSRSRILKIIALTVVALGSTMILVAFMATKKKDSSMSTCGMNLLQLYLGLLNFETSKKAFPPGAILSSGLSFEKGWSWIAGTIPYIEGNAPIIPDISKPWDDELNRHLLEHDKETGKASEIDNDEWSLFLCPSAPCRKNSAGYGLTSYVGVAGVGIDAPMLSPENPRAGLFGYREGTRTDQVKDGMATTLAIIETASANGPWRAAGPSTIRGIDRVHKPYIGKGRQFGGLHQQGVLVLFADGSIRFIRDNVNPSVFEAMSTIAGGEKISSDPWE